MSQLGKNALVMGGLALVAGALGLYAWYGVKEPAEREERQKVEDAKLLSFGQREGGDAGQGIQLEKVVVQAKGETTTLERKDGAWRIVAPVSAAVDAVAVDGLVSQLTSGSVKDVIEEAPTAEDLRRYGLDSPRFVVTAVAKGPGGGTRELVLKGGAENTFDGSIYLQRGDDPKVYSAQGGVRWSLEKTPFELRHKQVLAVTEKDLTRVEVQGPTHAYVVERGADDRWALEKPQAHAADQEALTQLLAGLANHSATAFFTDSPQERTARGLDQPLLTARFARREGEPITVQLGRKDASLYALRTEGAETILAQVPEGALGALDKDPAELRDRAVLSFKKEDVSRIVFTRGAERIVVERELSDGGPAENWRVLQPKEGRAQKWKLSSLLWALGSLKAKSLGEENPRSWAKYGLEKPEQLVELYGTGGKLLATLSLGSSLEGEEHARYARGSRNQVATVDTQRLSDLPATADDVLEESKLPLQPPTAAK